MGLQPIRGRLIDATDDGAQAASVTVLTHRFWTESLNSDETMLGKQIKLGDRASTIIGVLEPSVPYPAETQLIANVVTSSHHMSATMQDGRVHRMTELFGRLAPGASSSRRVAELRAIHGGMLTAHKEAYPVKDDFRINAVQLRDQITSPARTILLVLLAASGLIFVIACSNVANLILARSVRREGELAVRAALGASTGALRRTLLAESVLLCGAGAILGVLIARPMLAVIARYASRFSVRALDLTRRQHAALGRRQPGADRRRCCSRSFRGCRPPMRRRASGCRAAASASRPAPTAACGSSRSRRSPRRSCCWPAPARC